MNAPKKRRIRSAASAQPFDWMLLALLVAIGGSSFAMIKSAVATIPPAAVGAGRLWVGAALMFAIMRFAGRRFPPLIVKTRKGPRLHLAWVHMVGVGAVGYAGPFFIFPWAQQFIESGLAGVYMAFMPIWTLGLAYAFAGESLTKEKLIGFGLGFIGVMLLLGPDVIGGAARSGVLAQAALLLATFGYAASAVIARRAPPIRPRVFAAGVVLVGAILLTPALLLTELHLEEWSPTSIASIIGLGAGPTGIAGLFIIIVIKRVGAGFMALSNYITPVIAVLVGAALYHERLELRVFIALAIILVGVAISQRRRRAKSPAPGNLGEMEPVAETASAAAIADQTKI